MSTHPFQQLGDSRQESDPPTTFHFSSPGLYPTTWKTGPRAGPIGPASKGNERPKNSYICRELRASTPRLHHPLQFFSSSVMPTCRCQIRTLEGVDRAPVSAPGNLAIPIRLQSTHERCPKACWALSFAVYYCRGLVLTVCRRMDGTQLSFSQP